MNENEKIENENEPNYFEYPAEYLVRVTSGTVKVPNWMVGRTVIRTVSKTGVVTIKVKPEK